MSEQFITLPFALDPMPKMYHQMAFPMGIIRGNAKTDITEWLIGKYVNCIFEEQSINKFMIGIDDFWHQRDGVLELQSVQFVKETYDYLSLDYVKLIKNMLCMGFYPNGMYNEQYIPGKKFFQEKYFEHDYLFIGYNDITECFISVGYMPDGNFKIFDVPYRSFIDSLNSLSNNRFHLFFWKYNNNFQFVYNRDVIIQELNDYLNSHTTRNIDLEGKSFGVQAIMDLANYWYNSEHKFDVRYSRGLLEHKMLMESRIRFITDKNNCSHEALDVAKKVCTMAKQVHMLGIKYNFDRNVLNIETIFRLMKTIVEMEQKYLSFFVSMM